jgi:hypothetical protein
MAPAAPVAQLDRALPSEGRGREFESRRARHKINDLAESRSVSRECPGEKCGLLVLMQNPGGAFIAGGGDLLERI